MSDVEPASPGHQHRREAPQRVPTAVVTVSDTRTTETDTGGDLVAELLAAAGHEVVSRRIIRDAPEPIGAALRDCVSRATGGVLPELMRAGVRVGGAPWHPVPWRWGYGWDYCRGYDTEGDTPLQIESSSTDRTD